MSKNLHGSPGSREVAPVPARGEVAPVPARGEVAPVPAYHPESRTGRGEVAPVPARDEVVPVLARGTGQGATLAGGCFWCIEAVFDELKGVESVESGYSGGQVPNPTYARVCDGDTGHAEAIQVTFDPQVLSYHDLLTVFFAIHDPTTLNRQGADAGTQYRSAIFYHDAQQKEIARQVIQEIADAHIWDNPLVTEVTPFDKFYPAEDYHQEYFAHNSFQPYCRAVIAPKVSKFRKQFVDRLR